MPELRWILLILGAAFVAALAWWELKRQRRSPTPPEEPAQHRFREPTLGLPEMRPREPAPELPVLEIEDDSMDESMIGLRVDGVRIEEDLGVAPPDLARDFDEAPADEPIAEGPDGSEPAPALPEPEPSPAPALPEPEPLPEPVVDWPAEDERKLLAVRLVAQRGERFLGRALRLALTAEGFVLGKFSIFHKPGADGRVLVSAASLTQPGTFEAASMDAQRYGGLGLFAVLPGPLSDVQMFDALIGSARVLNERLQGALQDDRGEPLTALRIATLRERLEPPPPLEDAPYVPPSESPP